MSGLSVRRCGSDGPVEPELPPIPDPVELDPEPPPMLLPEPPLVLPAPVPLPTPGLLVLPLVSLEPVELPLVPPPVEPPLEPPLACAAATEIPATLAVSR